jgi:hypothetical protein
MNLEKPANCLAGFFFIGFIINSRGGVENGKFKRFLILRRTSRKNVPGFSKALKTSLHINRLVCSALSFLLKAICLVLCKSGIETNNGFIAA